VPGNLVHFQAKPNLEKGLKSTDQTPKKFELFSKQPKKLIRIFCMISKKQKNLIIDVKTVT
jgi:hypothetical protein